MYELSLPYDRRWKISIANKEYFLLEYNDEITGYSDELHKIAPDVIHFGGNAYYVLGKYAEKHN